MGMDGPRFRRLVAGCGNKPGEERVREQRAESVASFVCQGRLLWCKEMEI